MMKASELRIGNYIDRNGLMEVRTLNQKTIRIYDHYNKVSILHAFPAESFKGITLTEEWLLKFGWVWNEKCKSYEKYPKGDIRMNLAYKDVSRSFTMFNYVLKATICEKIFYVHQLQNLYFALTGKELEIK